MGCGGSAAKAEAGSRQTTQGFPSVAARGAQKKVKVIKEAPTSINLIQFSAPFI
jgi:hypothetical protein